MEAFALLPAVFLAGKVALMGKRWNIGSYSLLPLDGSLEAGLTVGKRENCFLKSWMPRSLLEEARNTMAEELSKIERLCMEKGLKMTGPRRIIARVLSEASDHPDADTVHQRAMTIDAGISKATVYRTVRLFEEVGILERHEFLEGRARYEEVSEHHHDHLIDTQSGKIIEFFDAELEQLKEKIARRLGFRLTGHRLELYGTPLPQKRAREESTD